ncbi:MAG: helix-turn-helix domain-containing protein [Planctomycetaceae bacterium]|nr:MAG: helix-turn-helix domain-containing protein [Planctomycetaceae bacterium]
MKSQVSPKQLARALQVSESSVKRWCDQGVIPTVRTAGGHRRIAISTVIDFLQKNDHRLVQPEILGLPVTTGSTERMLQRAQPTFREALLCGDEQQARAVVLDLFLADHELSAILDDVVARSLHEIGELWGCGDVDVYQERRACEISLRVLHEMRQVLPRKEPPVGLAIGGTPGSDLYHVPNTMVDLVLRQVGWDTHNLGVGLPFDTLRQAIADHRPRLFWLSVSHVDDSDQFISDYESLFASAPPETAFVVGGRALGESLRRHLHYASFCDNLRHLESFARSLATAPPQVSGAVSGTMNESRAF